MDAAIDEWCAPGAAQSLRIDTMGGGENPARVYQCCPADMLPEASLAQTANVRESPYRRFIALVTPRCKLVSFQ